MRPEVQLAFKQKLAAYKEEKRKEREREEREAKEREAKEREAKEREAKEREVEREKEERVAPAMTEKRQEIPAWKIANAAFKAEKKRLEEVEAAAKRKREAREAREVKETEERKAAAKRARERKEKDAKPEAQIPAWKVANAAFREEKRRRAAELVAGDGGSKVRQKRPPGGAAATPSPAKQPRLQDDVVIVDVHEGEEGKEEGEEEGEVKVAEAQLERLRDPQQEAKRFGGVNREEARLLFERVQQLPEVKSAPRAVEEDTAKAFKLLQDAIIEFRQKMIASNR